MKYIDADKLITEIKHRIKLNKKMLEMDSRPSDFGRIREGSYILSFIERIQQEQPEIGLEKFTEKVKTFQARYKHSESISVKGAMAFMARMFYQYPNVARQWYDSLPKATMDDARKEGAK